MRHLLTFVLVSSVSALFCGAAQADERMLSLTQQGRDVAIAACPKQATVASPKFTLASSIVAKYVSPHGFVLSEEPVLQSDFKVSWSNGLSVGIVLSTGTDDSEISSNSADEIDLYAGWTKKFGDWSVSLGVAHFNFVELDSFENDLIVAYAEIGRSFKVAGCHTLTPFVRMEERWRLPDFDWARAMPVVGVKHSWSIALGFTLNQRLGLMYDGGVPVSDDGLLLQYRIGMSCKLSDTVSLEPYVRLSRPLTIHDKRENQVILGITLSLNL